MRRISLRQEGLAAIQRSEARVAWGRLATAALAAVLGWLAFGPALISAIWLWIPIAAFVALLLVHERLSRSRTQAQAVLTFLQRRLARLSGEWQGDGPDGARFIDPAHPYAIDLDLFGRGSLFQLLSVASTPNGEARLAEWLMNPASADEIRVRQEAVRELAPKLDLREDLAPRGDAWKLVAEGDRLARWAAARGAKYKLWEMLLTSLVAMAAVTTLVGWFTGWGATPFFIALIALTAVSSLLRKRVVVTLADVTECGREIQALERVLTRLCAEKFESLPLRFHERDGRRHAVASLASLRRLIDLHDATRNQFFAPIGALLLWNSHLAFAFERWRHRHGAALVEWIDAVATYEALSSLATHSWEHPEDVFPELLRGNVRVEMEGVAHPLLPESEAVRNDLRFDERVRLYIVSGSNMSGKSTLLRSVGTNVVLAQCGSVVRARGMRLTPVHPGASIRISDSLEEGASRFYAEIRRLRQIVDLAESNGRTLLALLDEVLAGTNSHDRRIGAQAILRRLVADGAIGLVTTHDLALTRLAEDDDRVVNVHFEDRLQEGRMEFDYRLKEGVVTRSNAIALMRAVGLEV